MVCRDRARPAVRVTVSSNVGSHIHDRKSRGLKAHVVICLSENVLMSIVRERRSGLLAEIGVSSFPHIHIDVVWLLCISCTMSFVRRWCKSVSSDWPSLGNVTICTTCTSTWQIFLFHRKTSDLRTVSVSTTVINRII